MLTEGNTYLVGGQKKKERKKERKKVKKKRPIFDSVRASNVQTPPTWGAQLIDEK